MYGGAWIVQAAMLDCGLLEHDVEEAVVAGAADCGGEIVAGLHSIDVTAQVLAQVTAPGAFQQARGVDRRIGNVLG